MLFDKKTHIGLHGFDQYEEGLDRSCKEEGKNKNYMFMDC